MERPNNIAHIAAYGNTGHVKELCRYILWLEGRYELLDTLTRGYLTCARLSLEDAGLHLYEFSQVVEDTLRYLDGIEDGPDDGYVQVGWRCPLCGRSDTEPHHATAQGAVCSCSAFTPMEPVYVKRGES